jgi:hypothetical protein
MLSSEACREKAEAVAAAAASMTDEPYRTQFASMASAWEALAMTALAQERFEDGPTA